jgi:hypothetical protein
VEYRTVGLLKRKALAGSIPCEGFFVVEHKLWLLDEFFVGKGIADKTHVYAFAGIFR